MFCPTATCVVQTGVAATAAPEEHARIGVDATSCSIWATTTQTPGWYGKHTRPGVSYVAGQHEVGVILRCIADIVLGKHPQARAADELRAREFLPAIAGVRASDVASQEPLHEILPAPANVSVVIGAMPATYLDVIEGGARLVSG